MGGMVRQKPSTGEDRWVCPVLGCSTHYSRCNNLYHVHFKKAHPDLGWDTELPVAAFPSELRSNPQLAASLGSLGQRDLVVAQAPAALSEPNTSIADHMAQVELSSGRGQREKKPTEKVKDTTVKKDDPISDQLVPPKYKLPEHDSKWFEQPKEIPKVFDHTKVNEKTGEKIDFYKLGPQ
jgi:hypothetical protein